MEQPSAVVKVTEYTPLAVAVTGVALVGLATVLSVNAAGPDQLYVLAPVAFEKSDKVVPEHSELYVTPVVVGIALTVTLTVLAVTAHP